MGVESNIGKELKWGNCGDISFTVKLSEDSMRVFHLMMQSGLVASTMTRAKEVCEICQFDKKCDCCPFHGVFEMANAMKDKIENELTEKPKEADGGENNDLRY